MNTIAKVGHVVLSLEVGGLEKMVCDLVKGCSAHHISSVIYCLDERGALAEEVERAGIRVILLKRKRGVDLHLLCKLAKQFRQDGLTAVHTHNLDPMIYGGLAARLAGIARITHTQHDVHIGTYSVWERIKLAICSNVIRTMVGVSSETTRMLNAYDVRPLRCVTIANGVNFTKFSGRGGLGQRGSDQVTQEVVIGVVARLAPEKGLHCLLHALAIVRKSTPVPIVLEIAGDGTERRVLEELAYQLDLMSAVRFHGSLVRIDEFLRTLDVFVLPSLTEGIPLALLEAMASQLPVIGTRVGGVPEVVVHEESGILVSPNDSEALAQAILDMVRNPDRRTCLARNARERVKKEFGLDAMVRRYMRLYVEDVSESWIVRLAKRSVQRLLPNRLILWRHQVDRRIACLTFDDGPDGLYTAQILDILRQFQVKATFFLIGSRIADHRAVVSRIVDDGHELGNHSYTHPKFDQLSWPEAVREIAKARVAIEACSQKPSVLFRPPEGCLCLGATVGAWSQGQRVIMWNVDLRDCFAASPVEIEDGLTLTSINPGDIILYHGDSDASLKALPHLLERISREGVTLVTLSELLGAR